MEKPPRSPSVARSWLHGKRAAPRPASPGSSIRNNPARTYFDGEAVGRRPRLDRRSETRVTEVDAGAESEDGGVLHHERDPECRGCRIPPARWPPDGGRSRPASRTAKLVKIIYIIPGFVMGLPCWFMRWHADLDSDGKSHRRTARRKQEKESWQLHQAPNGKRFSIRPNPVPQGADQPRRGQPERATVRDCTLASDLSRFRCALRVAPFCAGVSRLAGTEKSIRIATSDCGTDVQGLYVAGDAASREPLAGATSRRRRPNSSWAIASGWWSGQGAAGHAKRRGDKAFRSNSSPLGQAGLRPGGTVKDTLTPKDVIDSVRAEVTPWRRTISARAAACRPARTSSTTSGSMSETISPAPASTG